MRYVAAYLLATLGGNSSPDASAIKAILSSVDVDIDDEKLSKFLGEMEGKSLNEVLEAGREKLSAVPSGGGAASAGASSADAGEEKKEEEPEEEEEEESDDMGFDLFG